MLTHKDTFPIIIIGFLDSLKAKSNFPGDGGHSYRSLSYTNCNFSTLELGSRFEHFFKKLQLKQLDLLNLRQNSKSEFWHSIFADSIFRG